MKQEGGEERGRSYQPPCLGLTVTVITDTCQKSENSGKCPGIPKHLVAWNTPIPWLGSVTLNLSSVTFCDENWVGTPFGS